MDAFEAVGYEGHLTLEYFQPCTHYPEALIHHMGTPCAGWSASREDSRFSMVLRANSREYGVALRS